MTRSPLQGYSLYQSKKRPPPNGVATQARLLYYHAYIIFCLVVVACCGIAIWNRWSSVGEDVASVLHYGAHFRVVSQGSIDYPNQGNNDLARMPGQSYSTKVLLASHGRLMWYDMVNNKVDILDDKHGIYYGGFYGSDDREKDDRKLWYVSRPHNWRPETAVESLVELQESTRQKVRSVQINSRFTHDVVRKGRFVYAADTERGAILEFELPDMVMRRRMELFTKQEHVNTLSPTKDGKFLWAMLHNLGPSILAKIDLQSGTIIKKIDNVGKKSHGAVQLDGMYANQILFLDSDHASLSLIDLETEQVKTLFSIKGSYFLKGLCVIDNIAFFGIAAAQKRQNRADESLQCELAAFDLVENRLIFRRSLPTKGLLNVVSAPHLLDESTSVAVTSNPPGSYRTALLMGTQSHDDGNIHVIEKEQKREQDDQTDRSRSGNQHIKPHVELPPDDPLHDYPAAIDSIHWDSGYPRLDNELKNTQVGFDGGIQLILYHEDLSDLKKAVFDLPRSYWEPETQMKENAYIAGRSSQLDRFKPGTKSIHLIFSDRNAENVFEFPWYRDKFKHLVKPLLQRLLGKHYDNVSRVQFALMPAQTEIKPHVDSGGYSTDGHRIHFVIASNPDVSFYVCEQNDCMKLHTEEGTVFELNNRLKHYVKNDGLEDRVHMVVDVAESPRDRLPLQVGQICQYVGGSIKCQ